MKRIFSYCIIGLLAFTIQAQAQVKPIKIGYTNAEYIISLTPESKRIENELKTYKTQLDKQGDEFVKEFQEKMEAYQKGSAMMSEPVKATKEKELMDKRASIEEFQKNAEADMSRKQQELLAPVLDKIQKAITTVAEENGYTYVFNSDAGFGTSPILLYGPEKDNITDLILKKIGITPPTRDLNKSKMGPKKPMGK